MLAPWIYALIVAALAALASPAPSTAAESPCPSVLDHEFSNLREEPVSLCQFRGKVLLIVNTASERKWGQASLVDLSLEELPSPFLHGPPKLLVFNPATPPDPLFCVV